MGTYRIAVIPGDGVGHEVVPAAIDVLDAVAAREDISFDWAWFEWGCEYYTRTGSMMPPDGIDQLRPFDAIFLGAVGYPGVPDHVSLWGLLIPIRRAFDLYLNVRPIRRLESLQGPLRSDEQFDFVVVRENTEGEYSEIGGRLYRGTDREIAVQESVFTRVGVERTIRYAFELAQVRGVRVDSATKSNGIIHTMPFWDEVFAEVGAQHPNVPHSQYHIDALAATFVLDPQRFGVVVASNLFGDILTDVGAAVAGSIGVAPSANLYPDKSRPSMFEPVHGSAPDIAGRGIANPVGQMWSGAMMLEHLGHPVAASRVTEAFSGVLAGTDVRTPDIGGSSTTAAFTREVIKRLDTSE